MFEGRHDMKMNKDLAMTILELGWDALEELLPSELMNPLDGTYEEFVRQLESEKSQTVVPILSPENSATVIAGVTEVPHTKAVTTTSFVCHWFHRASSAKHSWQKWLLVLRMTPR